VQALLWPGGSGGTRRTHRPGGLGPRPRPRRNQRLMVPIPPWRDQGGDPQAMEALCLYAEPSSRASNHPSRKGYPRNVGRLRNFENRPMGFPSPWTTLPLYDIKSHFPFAFDNFCWGSNVQRKTLQSALSASLDHRGDSPYSSDRHRRIHVPQPKPGKRTDRRESAAGRIGRHQGYRGRFARGCFSRPSGLIAPSKDFGGIVP